MPHVTFSKDLFLTFITYDLELLIFILYKFTHMVYFDSVLLFTLLLSLPLNLVFPASP